MTYCLQEGGIQLRINAITVLQFWRLILLPENVVFVFSLFATQFSESLEIFHDIFPDTFSQTLPRACLLQISNAENSILSVRKRNFG